jgi:ABC-type glycerol-3-phosphate transport system permease component
MKDKALRRGAAAFRFFILTVIALVLLAPLFWMAMTSFRPQDEIFRFATTLSIYSFIPMQPTLANYTRLLSGDFPRALANSVFVTLATVILGVVVNALAGFAFAVFRFKGSHVLFGAVVASFMMPFEAIILPLYILARWLNWTNSYQALILPDVANGFVIFLFRQCFLGMPKELFEAARVDGASWLRIFFKIAMPLSGPTIAAASLLIFVHQWDSFFWPLVVAGTSEYMVIPVAIGRFFSMEGNDWGAIFSAGTIATLLAAVPFLYLQKFYVKTMMGSAIK